MPIRIRRLEKLLSYVAIIIDVHDIAFQVINCK